MEIRRYVNGVYTEKENLSLLSVITPEIESAVREARKRAVKNDNVLSEITQYDVKENKLNG